jgi:tetratricopeptide (TPR) repeat protein
LRQLDTDGLGKIGQAGALRRIEQSPLSAYSPIVTPPGARGGLMMELEDAIKAIEGAIAAGNLLLAFDAATTALAEYGEQARLRYLQILALARMGETDRAQALYDEHLDDERDDLDIMALRARLVKDAGLHTVGDEAAAFFGCASLAYEEVFDRTTGAFPAINAATMAFLAGDRDRATELAHATLAALGRLTAIDNYYDAATAAEAQLLLGNEEAAERAIDEALALPGGNHGARSTTSRQIGLIVAASGLGQGVADRLRPPPVVTFCGHMLVADAPTEDALRTQIDTILDTLGSTIFYGALACGADILIAEQVLARGGELNVVLPFLPDDFIGMSVACGGDGWVARYRSCIDAANEVVVASETHAVGDDRQNEYGSMLMMGFARLRARHLETSAIQLAIWDGVPGDGVAGTAADVKLWRAHGGETRVIALDRTGLARPPAVAAKHQRTTTRAVRGMIFTDFAGFSKIEEPDLPAFWERVLGRAAEVVHGYEADVCSRNSWGDALYVVTRSASSAARLALDLQDAIDADGKSLFGPGAGMRVSAHLGAVYEAVDPLTGNPTFFGREVNRTARIEPITSVGEIYVTRAFGAVLELEEPGTFDLSYVGRVPLAKKFGEEPMYRLSRYIA